MGKGIGTRKFNGEVYHPGQYTTRKIDAQTIAKDFRKRGYKARIVPLTGGGYEIYFRTPKR